MSPAALDIVLLEPHEAALRSLLRRDDGSEASAYVLFGRADIPSDPWSGLPRTRLISHEVVPVAADEMVSASPAHVTWSTRGFMHVLGGAKERSLVAGLVHTHPNAAARDSSHVRIKTVSAVAAITSTAQTKASLPSKEWCIARAYSEERE